MINLRIEGTKQEISDFINTLRPRGYKVDSQSKFYPNREPNEHIGRIYIAVETGTGETIPSPFITR